jgi:rSAM/selenodomain-associated transferase 1
MPLPRHLILFAKAPRYGAVKTRLARDVGRLAAWMFYRRCLAATVRRLGRDRRWRTWLALTPDRAARDFRPRPGRGASYDARGDSPARAFGATVIPQGRGDLGARMARAFARVSENTRAGIRPRAPGATVLVGGDIPAIRPAHVAEAFRKLGAHDAVFGPAADGGYWLVGFRHVPPAGVFRGVRWSSPHALADTLANLSGSRVAPPLETLRDVDDGAALKRLRASGVP